MSTHPFCAHFIAHTNQNVGRTMYKKSTINKCELNNNTTSSVNSSFFVSKDGFDYFETDETDEVSITIVSDIHL